MTLLIKGKNSIHLSAPAGLIPDNRDVATTWASKYIVQNPNIKWVVSNYVQANTANRNGHMWQLENLRLGQPTISHSPMNMGHREHYIVGSYVGSEMIYPEKAKADTEAEPPYIETVAAFWRFYFPQEMAAVQAAYDSGNLWSSMECISDTVTCMEECGQTFAYAGPRSATYCKCAQAGGVLNFDHPQFLAGALVLPPSAPGWANADVQAIAALLKEHADIAEATIDRVKATAPHLSDFDVEQTAASLIHEANRKVHPLVLAGRAATSFSVKR